MATDAKPKNKTKFSMVLLAVRSARCAKGLVSKGFSRLLSEYIRPCAVQPFARIVLAAMMVTQVKAVMYKTMVMSGVM